MIRWYNTTVIQLVQAFTFALLKDSNKPAICFFTNDFSVYKYKEVLRTSGKNALHLSENNEQIKCVIYASIQHLVTRTGTKSWWWAFVGGNFGSNLQPKFHLVVTRHVFLSQWQNHAARYAKLSIVVEQSWNGMEEKECQYQFMHPHIVNQIMGVAFTVDVICVYNSSSAWYSAWNAKNETLLSFLQQICIFSNTFALQCETYSIPS